MAVKKRLDNGYSYEDLFDTQDALDNGILGSVVAGTTSTTTKNKGFLGFGASHDDDPNNTTTKDLNAGASDLGSILGMTDAIAANKKRKKEQTLTGANGFGSSNSILGGGGF